MPAVTPLTPDETCPLCGGTAYPAYGINLNQPNDACQKCGLKVRYWEPIRIAMRHHKDQNAFLRRHMKEALELSDAADIQSKLRHALCHPIMMDENGEIHHD